MSATPHAKPRPLGLNAPVGADGKSKPPKGWTKAITAGHSQIIADSYKNQLTGIVFQTEIDWAVFLALEINPAVLRFQYLKDPSRKAGRKSRPWQFYVKPRVGDGFFIRTFERHRLADEQERIGRRNKAVFHDTLPRPEQTLSNADANAYLVAAWHHPTAFIEEKIFSLLNDGVVRTLKEAFEIVGGNHPLFVAALLRLYITCSIDTNLDSAPLGWMTYVARMGVLKRG